MVAIKSNKFFYFSFCLHACIFLILILGFDFAQPIPVLENTHKNDVISVAILGDTEKSKILPQKPLAKPDNEKLPEIKKVVNQAVHVKQKKLEELIKQDILAIGDRKKMAEKKEKEIKKQKELFAKDLLADIKKQSVKQKKEVQANLKNQFEKSLHEQAEKTMRQHLLDEQIKLLSKQNREAQGIVNKYQALIIQAISDHWLVPAGTNKKLSCEMMIRLSPKGVVVDVQVTKSSGDPALDSSARAAVQKASPLPVPTEAEAFEPFKKFVLKVKPENILPRQNDLSSNL